MGTRLAVGERGATNGQTVRIIKGWVSWAYVHTFVTIYIIARLASRASELVPCQIAGGAQGGTVHTQLVGIVLARWACPYALSLVENVGVDATETDCWPGTCRAGGFANLAHHSGIVGVQLSATCMALLSLQIQLVIGTCDTPRRVAQFAWIWTRETNPIIFIILVWAFWLASRLVKDQPTFTTQAWCLAGTSQAW